LAEHVADAGLLEDGPGGAAGDDAGTGGRGLEEDPAGAHLADDGVDDGRPGEGHVEEVLAGLLGALLDGEGHLLGLAVAEADAPVAVADHHERGEREPPAALHHLGHAVDADDARLVERGVARRAGVVPRLALAVSAAATSSVGHQNSNPASRAASARAA